MLKLEKINKAALRNKFLRYKESELYRIKSIIFVSDKKSDLTEKARMK